MAKYDIDKVRTIFNKVKGQPQSRKIFIGEVKKIGVPQSTASLMYQHLKANKGYYATQKSDKVVPVKVEPKQGMVNPEQSQIPPEATVSVEQVPVETVSVSDIQVESQGTNPEAQDLSSTYAKMLEEEGSDDASSGEASDSSESSSGESSSGSMEYGAALSQLKGLWSQLAFTFNDLLMFPERPLTADERAVISSTSQNLNLQFFDDVAKDPNAGWYIYGLFGFVLPAVSRIDLLAMKFQNLFGVVKPQQPASPQQQRDEVQQQQENKPLWQMIELTPAQKSFIENYIQQGYNVSPNYDPNQAIDRDAFIRKVVRNMRDPYGG